MRVRGLPPIGEGGNLIGLKAVEDAMARTLPKSSYDFAPVIIGVDPAWTGRDSLEIVARQGMMSWLLKSIPKNENDVAVANLVAEFQDDLGAAAVFVDGGFGTGIWSVGKSQGRDNWHLVWFSGKTYDQECINLRAKMWKDLRDWIKNGGCLPDDEDLKTDLIAVKRKPRDDGKIQLVSKEDMELSPNKGDALALTFAMKVISDFDSKMLDNIVYESDWG